MKNLPSILLIILFIFVTNSKAANAISDVATKIHKTLDEQLAKNSKRYGVVGQSVLILKNHQPIYQGQHGFANIELGVAVTNKHLFPSYSVTKLFTSVLIMQQVELGNIELTKSIRTYLPYLPKHWHKITVEHLLSHTSGVPRYFDIAMAKRHFLPNKKAVFMSLVDKPEHFKMGSQNNYNNTNFLLLSAILEKQTAKSYQELVTDNIIKPLALKNTGHVSAKDIVKNMVTSYRGVNGTLRKNTNIDWPEYTFAHSALYSTAEDLTTFITALVTGKFVNKENLLKYWQAMKLTNGNDGRYAFGFEYSFEDGYYHAGHDGGNQVKLRYYFNPDNNADNYTLAYLTNGNTHGVWTDVLAESVMSIIAPKQFKIATLKTQFISAILEQNTNELTSIYRAISKHFNGDVVAIERFILYRAYALKYASGVKAAIPAFEFLVNKFPSSENAIATLADIKAAIAR